MTSEASAIGEKKTPIIKYGALPYPESVTSVTKRS